MKVLLARRRLGPPGPVLVGLVACLLACACRQSLPAPSRPFTPTPDAPFRSRHVIAGDVPVPDLNADWQTLENGLTIVHAEHPEESKITVTYVNREAGNLSSPCGGEAVDLTGRALVDAGTPWHGEVLTDLRVDEAGISVETGWDATTLGLDVRAPAFDRAVEVLAQMVRAPAFLAVGVENVVADALARSRMPAQRLTSVARERILTSMVGLDTAQDMVADDPRRLGAFTVEGARRCYADVYRPESSAMIVVGPISRSEAVEVVRRYFQSWAGAAPSAPRKRRIVPIAFPAAGVRFHVANQYLSQQVWIFMGQLAPTMTSDDFVPYLLAREILDGTSESRMNHVLRHDEAATDGFGADLWASSYFGVLWIGGRVDPSDPAHAIRVVREQIQRMMEETMSPEELALAKVRVGVELEEEFSSNAGMMRFLRQTFIANAPELLARRVQTLRAITAAQVRDVARRYFHPRSVDIVLTGDARDLTDELESTGSIDRLDLSPQ